MPVRIPVASKTEVWCMGAASIPFFAPFYLMAPGADARLSKQTAKWAPRWERNISHFKNPAERGIQRITPPLERAVHRLEQRVPMERAVRRVDRGIKRNLERFGYSNNH